MKNINDSKLINLLVNIDILFINSDINVNYLFKRKIKKSLLKSKLFKEFINLL